MYLYNNKLNIVIMKNLQEKFSVFKLCSYIYLYKYRFIATFIALSFSSLSFLSIGVVIKEVINKGFVAQSVFLLNQTIVFLLILVFVLAVASAVRVYLIESTSEKITIDIRQNIYNNLVNSSISYFDVNKVNDVLSRIINDTILIQNVINTVFSFFLRNTILIIAGMFLLFTTSIKLSLYVLALIPVVVIPIILSGKKVKRTSQKSQVDIANITGHIEETLSAIRTVKIFNQTQKEKLRLTSIMKQFLESSLNRIVSKSTLVGTTIFMISAAVSAVIWLGGRMILSGELNSGELVSFIFYSVIVASAVGGMSEVIADLNKASGAAERLFELLLVKPETRHDCNKAIKLTSALTVEFKNIAFAYPARPSAKVIENFSIKINAGEKVALIGESGVGKSTIFKLLLGFYKPTEGEVLLNGVSINLLDINIIRDAIGLVSHDSFIFSTSAYNNIAYGKIGATESEVLHAAKLANIDDFIRTLPDGYNSLLGEKGVNLSSGQRQRIAIARAILKNPQILLLDEATNNLDRHNEEIIQQSLNKLMIGRTTIIISHHKSSIKNCNRTVRVKSMLKEYATQD